VIVAAALIAGGLGAVARYVVSGAVQGRVRSSRPWGTAAVNVTGAVALGVLAGLVRGGVVEPAVMVVLGAGFLGSYTTFSTWMVETVRLSEVGGRSGVRAGLGNVGWPLVVGLVGATIGWIAGGWL
jgi:fluoride exporter